MEPDEARQFVSALGKYNIISKSLYNTQSAFVPKEPITASRSEILGPLRKLVIIRVRDKIPCPQCHVINAVLFLLKMWAEFRVIYTVSLLVPNGVS